jgi:hypothetical protein
LHPDFDGGASWIKRGAYQRYFSLDGLFDSRDGDLRRIPDLQLRRFGLWNVPLGNQFRNVHHREQRLIRLRQITHKQGPVGHYAINRATDFRITELRLRAPKLSFRRKFLSFRGLQDLLFSHALQVRELPLSLLVLAARRHERNFRGIQVPPRHGSLLKQFLAAVVDLFLRVERGFRRRRVQFRFLDLLRQTCLYGSRVGSLCLLVVALARFRSGGQIGIFQYRQQLTFFHLASALHEKLLDRRRNFRRHDRLLQRRNYGFLGNLQRNVLLLRRRHLHADFRLFLFFFFCAAADQPGEQHRAGGQRR